jgi:AcrR family transcriptional regulator
MIAARRKRVKPKSRSRRRPTVAAEGSAPASGRGRRSAAEARSTRERLLRQAERLFAGKGYNGASLRELAAVGGVRMFTVQHHFGSKRGLYEELLRRWDTEVQALLARVLETAPPGEIVERVVDELFDFFLTHRGRVALNARAVLGEGLPRRLALADRGWVRFMGSAMAEHRLGGAGFDPGLLLVTVEGVLHNHVLASRHYRHLFGRDVTDPRVAARVKKHLQRVILALLGHPER